MVYVGIEIGNATSCVALTARGRRTVDVIANSEGRKETPTVVQYGTQMRAVGSKATGGHACDIGCTIAQVKRLIGKGHAGLSPTDTALSEVVLDEKIRPGFCMINVQGMCFSPEQVLASVLKDLKRTAADHSKAKIDHAILSIPCYYSQVERLSMLASAKVAGLENVTLMHELTAAAVDWIASRPEYPKIHTKNVVFVDVGHSATQVCIVAFSSNYVQVKAHAWDDALGGRDLDDVLINHFAREFQEEHGQNIMACPRARVRLAKEVSKCRHLLTVSNEADLSVDMLMGDQDLRSKITLSDFEQLSAELVVRVESVLHRAMMNADMRVEDIDVVERVGGASRTPAIVDAIKRVFRLDKEPKSTINQKECVARGCTIHAARRGGLYAEMPQIVDIYPYEVLCCIQSNNGAPDEHVGTHRRMHMFSKSGKASFMTPAPPTEWWLPKRFPAMSGGLQVISDPDRSTPEEAQTIIQVDPVEEHRGYRCTWNAKFSLNDSGIISAQAETLTNWGWPRTARAQYIARVPHRVLDKWIYEETALTERDSAHIRNVRDRNELERQMLQLRRSTCASGSYGKVITDSERAEIDRLLSEVEAMLANPDTQRHECTVHIGTFKEITSELQMRVRHAEQPMVAATYREDRSHREVDPPCKSANDLLDHSVISGRGAPVSGKTQSQALNRGNGPDPAVMQQTMLQITDGFARLNDRDIGVLCSCPSGPTVAMWLDEVLERLTEVTELKAAFVAKQCQGQSRTGSRDAHATAGQAAATKRDHHDDQASPFTGKQQEVQISSPSADPEICGQPAAMSEDDHDDKVSLGDSQCHRENQPGCRAETMKTGEAAEAQAGDYDAQMTCTSHVVELSSQGSTEIHDLVYT